MKTKPAEAETETTLSNNQILMRRTHMSGATYNQSLNPPTSPMTPSNCG